ncbi:hypothetical protein MMPV_002362 [Pyropia vietnamensis]
MASIVWDDDLSPDRFRDLTRAYFDTRSATYNSSFHQLLADDLLRHFPPPPGGDVLDVAAGTGAVALSVAATFAVRALRIGVGTSNDLGNIGRVVAYDLSPGMLSVATASARAAGLDHLLTPMLGTAEGLPGLTDCSFDAVYCCSSLAYFVNVPSAIAAWARVLRPGGFAAYQSFSVDSFVAGVAMAAAVRRVLGENDGRRVFSLPLESTADPETCVALLTAAGFERVAVVEEDLTRRVDVASLTSAYEEPQNPNSFCTRLNGLDPTTRAAVQAAYVAEVEARRGADGSVEDVQRSFNVIGYKPMQ